LFQYRIHISIDRLLNYRKVDMQLSVLIGCAGLALYRTEGLTKIERRLLNAELALFEAVQERIAESDSLVRNLAAGDPRVRWVRTIPGFGRFFAVLVVHEIGTIRRFATPEKLSAYAGLVPSVHASGGKVFHGL